MHGPDAKTGWRGAVARTYEELALGRILLALAARELDGNPTRAALREELVAFGRSALGRPRGELERAADIILGLDTRPGSLAALYQVTALAPRAERRGYLWISARHLVTRRGAWSDRFVSEPHLAEWSSGATVLAAHGLTAPALDPQYFYPLVHAEDRVGLLAVTRLDPNASELQELAQVSARCLPEVLEVLHADRRCGVAAAYTRVKRRRAAAESNDATEAWSPGG